MIRTPCAPVTAPTSSKDMSNLRILPLALALALPAVAQDDAKPKHDLKFAFKPGTVANQVMTQDMTMTMSMGPQDMVTTMSMSMFQTYTVTSVNDNKASIEQKVTRVKATMDNPMQQIEYDSDEEGSDPGMLEGLADLVDQKMELKLSDRGAVSDVKAPEDVAGPGGVDLEGALSQIIVSLPEEPVAIGDTWTVNQKVPMGQMGESATEVTYKLISVDDAVIVLDQTLNLNASDMEAPQGMEIASAKANGRYTIDRRTGLPKTYNLDMTVTMEGQMDMAMEVKVTMKPAPKVEKAPVTGPKKGAGEVDDTPKKDAPKKEGGK